MKQTKVIDPITKRCENCGGPRKEHGVKSPFRCQTKLKESYWTPWTRANYDLAVKTGEGK